MGTANVAVIKKNVKNNNMRKKRGKGPKPPKKPGKNKPEKSFLDQISDAKGEVKWKNLTI